MRNGRFTIVELFVVILASALLASWLVSCRGFRGGHGHQAGCGMNLSAIGKAIGMYKAAYRDRYPHINGTTAGWLNDIGSADRKSAANPGPGEPAADLPVSRLMWMFVREGQPPAAFICPMTKDEECPQVQYPDPADPDKMIYYWDFQPTSQIGGKTQCSYAFQVPAIDPSSKVLPGMDENCDEQMPIMADRNPAGGQAGWQPSLQGKALRRFMSQNHKGEYINFLRAGGSCGNAPTPLCGQETKVAGPGGAGLLRDHIYTASKDPADPSPTSTAETASAHLNNVNDSFLYLQKVPDGTQGKP